jgi:hypothetical protein
VINLVRNTEAGSTGGGSTGFDLCAGSQGKTLLATRASGQAELVPNTIGAVTSLEFGIPIYRGASVPTTEAARLDMFVGWVGMSIFDHGPCGSSELGCCAPIWRR